MNRNESPVSITISAKKSTCPCLRDSMASCKHVRIPSLAIFLISLSSGCKTKPNNIINRGIEENNTYIKENIESNLGELKKQKQQNQRQAYVTWLKIVDKLIVTNGKLQATFSSWFSSHDIVFVKSSIAHFFTSEGGKQSVICLEVNTISYVTEFMWNCLV